MCFNVCKITIYTLLESSLILISLWKSVDKAYLIMIIINDNSEGLYLHLNMCVTWASPWSGFSHVQAKCEEHESDS